MKKFVLLTLLMILFTTPYAQDNAIPEWYMKKMASQVGKWVADNKEYISDDEPFTEYVIEWKWAFNKQGLTGKLYGRKGEELSPTFWEFRTFWDAKEKKPVVMQFGLNGAYGTGNMRKTGEDETELVQTFTWPDGSQHLEGHRTKAVSETENITTSFSINEKNEWKAKRTYTWHKVVEDAGK